MAISAGALKAGSNSPVVIPVSFALKVVAQPTTNGIPGRLQTFTLNNSNIIQRIGYAIDQNVYGVDFGVTPNGHLVFVDTNSGYIDWDLDYNYNDSNGDGEWVDEVNGVRYEYYFKWWVNTDCYPDYQFFSFFDPVFNGYKTNNAQFNLTGQALTGYTSINWGYGYYADIYSLTNDQYIGNTNYWGYNESVTLNQGAKANLVSALKNGVYTQNFNIFASGVYDANYIDNGLTPTIQKTPKITRVNNVSLHGYVSGTETSSGIQTAGYSFLDPNYEDYFYGFYYWWW